MLVMEWKFELDFNGKPIRSYGITQDVTNQKIAELKLESQNRELIKTNAELDRFVYSVSHDLRSPLTNVLGLLSLIEDESNEKQTLLYADMIRGSINRLDSFIKTSFAIRATTVRSCNRKKYRCGYS